MLPQALLPACVPMLRIQCGDDFQPGKQRYGLLHHSQQAGELAIRIDACRLVEVENLVINLLPYDGTQATYA